MSEHLHPALHPDADSLSAFIEGVLPEHERLACLGHLAECSRCRQIVYLAQNPHPEPALVPVAVEPIRFWKRWFAPMPAMSALAVVCLIVLSIALYDTRPVAPAPELTSSNRAPVVESSSPTVSDQPPALDATPIAPRAVVRVHREPIPAERPAATVETAQATPPPSPVAPSAALPAPPPAVPPTASAALMASQSPNGGLAGIAGTVTDPAGAVVPKARINLQDESTGGVFTSTSDARGQFNVVGLSPGRYRLNVFSPGFKQSSKQIDLQPQEIAKADSILEVGASTETVTVNAEAPLLKTESGELSHVVAGTAETLSVLSSNNNRGGLGIVNKLPDRLPAMTTAAKDKLTLAADSAGRLFLSKNAGKSWKVVKGPWQGKVVRLAAVPDPANSSNTLFQLTTDSASVWLSRDGNRWYPASTRP